MSSEPEGESDLPHRQYLALMVAAILGSSIAFVDGSLVAIALPAIRADLGASLEALQWMVGGYALMLAAFVLPGGSAGDVFGRKRIFLIGVAIYTLGSLWTAIARSPLELIAARLLEGFGAAFMIPASLALITTHVDRAHRGRAIGLWASASAASTVVGPLLGGAIVDGLGWRFALLLTVPFGIATFIVAWRGVPESRPSGGHMDWVGGFLAALGLGALAWWLTALAADPSTVPPLGLLLAALGLLALFLWQQTRSREPMMPLRLFADRSFGVANLQTVLIYCALQGTLTYLPVVLIDAHGYSATMAGLSLMPFVLVIAVLSRASGALADRIGTALPLTLGPLVTACGFAGLIWVGASGDYWQAVLPVMTLLGIGMGITVAPISTTVMNAVAETESGTASGINNALSRAAGLIGVPLFALAGQIGYAMRAAGGGFGEPSGAEASDYGAAMGFGLGAIGLLAALLAAGGGLAGLFGLLLPDRSERRGRAPAS